MRHVCPECNGDNVRRESTPVAERTWRNNFSSRYRCRDCLHEFWAIRQKTYAAVVTLMVAMVLAMVIAVFMMERMFNNP